MQFYEELNFSAHRFHIKCRTDNITCIIHLKSILIYVISIFFETACFGDANTCVRTVSLRVNPYLRYIRHQTHAYSHICLISDFFNESRSFHHAFNHTLTYARIVSRVDYFSRLWMDIVTARLDDISPV